MSSPFSFRGNFLFSSWSRFVFGISEPGRPSVNFLLTLLAAAAPVALRHGNGGRLHGPPRGRPATSATGRARSEVLGRPRRDPAATADPWRREAGSRSPGPSPGAGPPAGHAGPILGAASRESQLRPRGRYPGRPPPPPGSPGRPRPCLRPPGLPAMGGAPGAGRGGAE